MSEVAALWPAGLPLACLGGGGRFAVVATHFREVTWDRMASLPLRAPQAGLVPMRSGYMGVLSYDQCAGVHTDSGGAPPRLLRVESALVFDRQTQQMYVPDQQEPIQPGDIWVDAASLAARLRAHGSTNFGAINLAPHSTDCEYERTVERVLTDIRDGRFYQLNLLRYFTTTQKLSRAHLAARLDQYGGNFACYFDLPGLSLVSLSPERFVRIRGDEFDGAVVETFPIKGTVPRHEEDPLADQTAADSLRGSAKDMAELAMIVDLMRNDLYRVSAPGSVRVLEAATLISAKGVHHLQARVAAQLLTEQTLGELLVRLCPAGSITGAPKREVIRAIYEYEQRQRGYFMGHAFYFDDSGAFDSSVLIRTLVGRGDGAFDYAAGSGIVIGSNAKVERCEIEAKCRAATRPHRLTSTHVNLATRETTQHGHA